MFFPPLLKSQPKLGFSYGPSVVFKHHGSYQARKSSWGGRELQYRPLCNNGSQGARFCWTEKHDNWPQPPKELSLLLQEHKDWECFQLCSKTACLCGSRSSSIHRALNINQRIASNASYTFTSGVLLLLLTILKAPPSSPYMLQKTEKSPRAFVTCPGLPSFNREPEERRESRM